MWDNLGGKWVFPCRTQQILHQKPMCVYIHNVFFVFLLFCFLALVVIVDLWNEISPLTLSVCVLQVASCWDSAAGSQVETLRCVNSESKQLHYTHPAHWEKSLEASGALLFQIEATTWKREQRSPCCTLCGKYICHAVGRNARLASKAGRVAGVGEKIHVLPQTPGSSRLP